MGSKKTTTTNATQTNAPPAFLQPGFDALGARINTAAAAPTDPLVSGLTDQAVSAYQGAAATSGAVGQGLIDNALSKDYGVNSVDQNVLHNAIDANVHGVMNNLLEQTLPTLKSSAVDAGAYSGSRALTQLPELALRDANTQAGDIGAQYTYQSYNDALNRDLQWQELLPQILQSGLGDKTAQGDILNSAAGTLAAKPYLGMDIATQLLHTLAGNYGVQNLNETSTTKSGGLGSVVGGVLGSIATIAGFPGVGAAVSGLFKPVAAATGVGVGGM